MDSCASFGMKLLRIIAGNLKHRVKLNVTFFCVILCRATIIFASVAHFSLHTLGSDLVSWCNPRLRSVFYANDNIYSLKKNKKTKGSDLART